MEINEILKYADRLILVIKSFWDNTVPNEFTYEQVNGGCIPNAGHPGMPNLRSNAEVLISNGRVHNQSTSQIMLDGLSISGSLPRIFSGSVVKRTIANTAVAGVSDIENRHVDQKQFEVLVGGLIHKGKANEQLLEFSEYKPWFDGHFVSQPYGDETKPQLAMALNSDAFRAKYPISTYQSGDSEGKAKSIILGSINGVSPDKIDGDSGLWRFTNGPVDTGDDEVTELEIAYTGYGVEYLNSDTGSGTVPFEMVDGVARDSSGYTTYTRDDHDFVNDNDKKVDFSGALNGSVEVSGDGASIIANTDNSLTIIQGESSSQENFNNNHFKWSKVSSTQLENLGPVKCKVTITGGLTFGDINGYWFKTTGTSSGTVTFEFEDIVSNSDLVIRGADTGVNSWVVDPDSVSPDYGRHVNSVVGHRGLNSNSISFDIDGAVGNFTAYWFNKISLHSLNPIDVKIKLPSNIAYLELGWFAQPGSMGASNFSTRPTSPPSQGSTRSILTFDDGAFNELIFTYNSGYGSLNLFFNEMRVDASDYGVKREDNKYVLKPPPVASALTATGLVFRLKGDSALAPPYVFGSSWQITGRAKLSSGAVQKVYLQAGWGGSANVPIIRLGEDWEDFSVDAGAFGNGSYQPYVVQTSQGDLTSKGGVTISNPIVDFGVDIELISVMPIYDYPSEIEVYSDDNSTLVKLRTYLVDNAQRFQGLPPGVAVYDKNGFLAANKSYIKLINKGIGHDADIKAISAFRYLSLRSTGIDHITCDFDGPVIGFPMGKQDEWFKWVENACNSLGYFIKHDLVGDGFTILKRFKYGDLVEGFTIEESMIEANGVKLLDSQPRERQLIIEYDTNYSVPELTKSVKSDLGYLGDLEPKTIPTPLKSRADAVELADYIHTEAMPNVRRTIPLIGVGHDLYEGSVHYINHPKVPSGKPCVIDKVTPIVRKNKRTTLIEVTVKMGPEIV